MNQVFEHRDLPYLRKIKKVTQGQIADAMGLKRTTYAYKEETGSFDESEMKQIAKYLKVDMTTISWTKPIFPISGDPKIQELKEENLKLQAEVKLLKELVSKFMEKR